MAEELILDQFRLENCVATGSSSQIWEVTDQDSNERYAMKLLLDEAFKDSAQKAILKKEFKVANAFEHPNIIQVFSHRQTRKNAYYTMEYFSGPNLKQIIRGDRLVVHSRLRKFVECLVMAIGHIHEKGWLHRDIKPDNIMMTKASDVRLIDFSLSSKKPSAVAKMISGKTKVIQGTRTYLAPELIRKKLPCVQSDFYSLGVTIFECLTGRPPFLGSTPNELLIKHVQEPPPLASAFNSNVTSEMDNLLLKLMAKKPENRPADAGELLAEFRSVKIFEEEPHIYQEKIKKEEEEAMAVSMEAKLDSRADALRSDKNITEGETATPKTKPAPKPTAKQPPQPVMQQQASPPTQPVQPPPQQPVYAQPPGAAPPAWQYGQPAPGQQFPGQPMPGQQIPAQPMPGYPMQQPPAGGGVPQQVPSGQQPAAQQQAAAAPQTQQPKQPAPAKKVVPPPVSSKEIGNQINLDDLPLMDELPDIS